MLIADCYRAQAGAAGDDGRPGWPSPGYSTWACVAGVWPRMPVHSGCNTWRLLPRQI